MVTIVLQENETVTFVFKLDVIVAIVLQGNVTDPIVL